MATTTITNISNQVIPVLVGTIALANADSSSSIASNRAEQTAIAPGAQLIIETTRVDIAQLEQLARKKLISYTSF